MSDDRIKCSGIFTDKYSEGVIDARIFVGDAKFAYGSSRKSGVCKVVVRKVIKHRLCPDHSDVAHGWAANEV